MFDIHYHLIFGVDDGPRTIEDSLALAEESIAEGVTHIVATPHASHEYPYQADVNQQRLATLRELLAGRLTVGIGCDFHLSFENIAEIEADPSKFTINGTNYLLVEFPDHVNVPVYTEVFFRMLTRGVVPIITHPERNESLKKKPSAIQDWVNAGSLVQVTAASLSGRFGKSSQSFAHNLIRSNLVHFLASDAHNTQGRRPAMAEAYRIVKADFGTETAERLCIHNPEAVFFGRPLPPQPEPTATLYYGSMQKKSLLRRIFG